jgi:hypothetical protein
MAVVSSSPPVLSASFKPRGARLFWGKIHLYADRFEIVRLGKTLQTVPLDTIKEVEWVTVDPPEPNLIIETVSGTIIAGFAESAALVKFKLEELRSAPIQSKPSGVRGRIDRVAA